MELHRDFSRAARSRRTASAGAMMERIGSGAQGQMSHRGCGKRLLVGWWYSFNLRGRIVGARCRDLWRQECERLSFIESPLFSWYFLTPDTPLVFPGPIP